MELVIVNQCTVLYIVAPVELVQSVCCIVVASNIPLHETD